MKLKIRLLMLLILVTNLGYGNEVQNKQLAMRIEALRVEMAPFLQSLPKKLDVRKIQSLSGNEWIKRFEVKPKGKTSGVRSKHWEKVKLNTSKWEQAEVPEYMYTEQYRRVGASCILWYRKIFNTEQISDDRRKFIVFDGVDWEAEVWLNGHKLGNHITYFEPFRFDVTNLLSKSGTNTLAIRVIAGPLYGEPSANWGPFAMPPAKDQHYLRNRSKSLGGLQNGDTHMGSGYGIFGDVYLETTGLTAIDKLLVRGYPAKEKVVIQVYSDTLKVAPKSIKIELIPENFKGKSYNHVVLFKLGKKSKKQTMTLKMADARHWSPDAPWLYRCRVTLLDKEDSIIDVQDTLFGYRTIEMVSPANPKKGLEVGTLLLDGEPLFLRGTNIQGLNTLNFWGETKTIHDIILLLKAADFNSIRSCQHIQFPEIRELLDRYGIMSQQDVGSGRHNTVKTIKGVIKANELISHVVYNNPGVVLLSMANECEHNPKKMVKAVLQGDSERIMVPISGRLSKIRPDQFPKWVSKEYYDWHHTYIINKDAWKGVLPEYMRNQILDSIHPYWGWYPEKGQLNNWCRIQAPGRMTQVGEFGSEALDGYKTMLDYPSSFGPTPSKDDDVLWGEVQVLKDDIRQFVGFRGKHPSNLGEYITASQTYQYDQLSQMTKAWRLSPKRINAYFQFHFIDVLPANWPKSIVSHDLTPKKAYFAMAQINQPLVPLPRLLAGGNEMELWVSNHKRDKYKNCEIQWTATSDGQILAKGSQKVDIPQFGAVLAGIADLSSIKTEIELVDINLVLKDSNGKQLSSYTQEIYIHAWRLDIDGLKSEYANKKDNNK